MSAQDRILKNKNEDSCVESKKAEKEKYILRQVYPFTSIIKWTSIFLLERKLKKGGKGEKVYLGSHPPLPLILDYFGLEEWTTNW